MYKYVKTINSIGNIFVCNSKRLSNESIKTPSTFNNYPNPLLSYVGTKIRVKFSGSCLKQNAALYNHGTIVIIFIVYEINKNYNISSYPTLENCLFGAANLTKHANIDQYKYYGYGIGFIRKGEFSFGSNEFGRYERMFGTDMSSYGCAIGFIRKGEFSFGSNRFGRYERVFGADMSSSGHVNNKTKYFNPW